MKNKYNSYLIEYGYREKYSLEERVCSCNMSFLKLRDGLLRVARILKEDFENRIYVVSVKSGTFGGNNAIVICELEDGALRMISFAKEGLINQNTCTKAMDKIEEILK